MDETKRGGNVAAVKVKAKDRLLIIKDLLEKQDNKCPICGRDLSSVLTRNICIDHDHSTGMIRGALCRNCNGIEGKINNLVKRVYQRPTASVLFQRLLDYWKWHKDNPSGLIYHTYKKGEYGKKYARKTKRKNY